MGVLLGDVNSTRKVDPTDLSVTQSKVGQALSKSNLREDVNADGAINNMDVNIVQSKVGTSVLVKLRIAPSFLGTEKRSPRATTATSSGST